MRHAARAGVLLLAAAFGHYLGDVIGSKPLDALPYEHWGPATYEYYHRGFFIGVFTTGFAYFTARLLRFPDLAVLIVGFLYSLILPVYLISTVGDPLFSIQGLLIIWGHQIPYFLGMLSFFGVVFVAKTVAKS